MKALAASVLFTPAILTAEAANWPQFRGPGGAGIADNEAAPPATIEAGRGARWSVDIPAGSSSPVVWGGSVFLTGFDAGKLVVFCRDLATGAERWRKEVPASAIEEFHAKEGSPAASTPATDGERVVAYFGSAGLVCFDMDGAELWKVPMPVAKTNNGFGSGTSPIIAGDYVVLVRDLSEGSAIHAFDKKTGRLAWTAPREGFATGYSTPVVWEYGGARELIAPGGLRVKAYDLATGAERWMVRETASVNCASPVVAGGMLIFAGWSPGTEDAPMPSFDDILKGDTDGDGALSKAESLQSFLKDFFESNDVDKSGKITRDEWEAQLGYLKRGKNRLIAIKPGGKGDVTESHVAWEATKGLPYVPTPLYFDGRVFTIKDGGMASLFEAKSGRAIYTQQRVPGLAGSIYASPVLAGGHIYLAGTAGDFVVIKAGDKLEAVCQTKFDGRISATPAIAGGTILIRAGEKLHAFGN